MIIFALVAAFYLWRVRVNRNPYEEWTEYEMLVFLFGDQCAKAISDRLMQATYICVMRDRGVG